MRNRKQMMAAVLLIFCLALTALPVYAADELLGTVVDGSLLTDEDSTEVTVYPKARGSILAYGTGGLLIAGKRLVKLSGTTAAYRNVSQVQVTMYLQRLVSGSWKHVLTMGPKIKYNTNIVSNTNTYSVTGGYYYRAYGAHTAIDGSTSESTPSSSNGIWVS